jgi:hypothetical protein
MVEISVKDIVVDRRCPRREAERDIAPVLEGDESGRVEVDEDVERVDQRIAEFVHADMGDDA